MRRVLPTPDLHQLGTQLLFPRVPVFLVTLPAQGKTATTKTGITVRQLGLRIGRGAGKGNKLTALARFDNLTIEQGDTVS